MNTFGKLSIPLGLILLTDASFASTTAVNKVTSHEVAIHYTDIAHAVFSDALTTAQQLRQSIQQLIESPSERHLMAARQAWIQARVPYQQSEVFRFGNPNVDDWEGQVNAWPLDEGLIDYVSDDYEHELGNMGANANIIANTQLTIGNRQLDTTRITPDLLASLNELGGSEANVATGYHAIEFLLWGQDLHGLEAGAGERAYTDFIQGPSCTNDHCDRRAQYLNASTELLIRDLDNMVAQWAPNEISNYRSEFLSLPDNEAIRRMFYGMGSLSLGELAGQRIKVALEANSTEDEQDCFSDNTHYAHYYDAKGVENIYLGQYQTIQGDTLSGPSLSQLVNNQDSGLDQTLKAQLSQTDRALETLVNFAEQPSNPIKFDQMIAPDNKEGEQLLKRIIGSLVEQTVLFEKAANKIGIDNLNPDTADTAF